jgi:hypothetical protein
MARALHGHNLCAEISPKALSRLNFQVKQSEKFGLGGRPNGKPRSYRDTKTTAIEGAEYLKQRHPHSEVTVKDVKSGEVTVAAL